MLGAASVVAAALILYLNRGSSFFFDEAIWFSDLAVRDGLDSILHPHNSHLIGTTRTIFLFVVNVFGPEYLIIRLLAVASVIACAWVFFVLIKRRVGPWAALVPSILLLVFGSAWQHVAGPIGLTITLSATLGLGALLALDREDPRDLAACLLLTASVFTYTVGLPFLVGIAVLILLGRDRIRRAWVFLVPLALYTAWWLWASQFDQGREQVSNLTEVPRFFAESAANIAGSISGVNGVLDARPNALGWILAALALAALLFRLSRGGVPKSLWASLAILGTYWLAAALADNGGNTFQAENDPGAVRYVYPATIGVLLVATDAVRGLRIGRAGYAALFAVGLFAVAMNLTQLRDGAAVIRSFGEIERVNLAMLELADGREPGGDGSGEDPAARPEVATEISFLALGPDREDYLAASARYGSPAFTLDEIRGNPARVPYADSALVQAYGLRLEDGPAAAKGGECDQARTVELQPGSSYSLSGEAGAEVFLSRFGPAPGYGVGVLETGGSMLDLPEDPAQEPWRASAATGSLVACPAG